MPIADAMIAAIAKTHGAKLATRNLADFDRFRARVDLALGGLTDDRRRAAVFPEGRRPPPSARSAARGGRRSVPPPVRTGA